MKKIFTVGLILSFFIIGRAFAESVPSSYVITIQSVELKNNAGQWVTVIEPDRQVDLKKEEPGLSFFNNGRVPDGDYVNFKVKFFNSPISSISGTQDFQVPLRLKRGSFVGVWFSLDIEKTPPSVSRLNVTVDEDARNLRTEDVKIKLDQRYNTPHGIDSFSYENTGHLGSSF